MAEGEAIDIQRESRWPNQTATGVKVELKPWEEDSDYSDEEGVIPPMPGYNPEVELNDVAETPVAAWSSLWWLSQIKVYFLVCNCRTSKKSQCV